MAIETVAIFLSYDSRETFIKDRHIVIPVTFGKPLIYIKWQTQALIYLRLKMSPLPAGIWQKLCISASNLRHALINGTFSVLFEKRCRSVLSVISGSLFVCLFLYRFKKVHFRRGFSKVVINTHWSYRGVGSVLSPLLKRPKTESFCKLIKYAPILDTLQHRWATRQKKQNLYFRQQFSIT